MKIIVGLGNPGERYAHTRHNIGRDVVELLHKKHTFSEWTFDKKSNAQQADGVINGVSVRLVLPETFMNDSGISVAALVKTKKQLVDTCAVYDDLDLGLGSMKFAFDRGAGGHKGITSIIAKTASRAFVRLRIGIAPVTPTGKIKKVQGDDAVKTHVLTPFKKKEQGKADIVCEHAVRALELYVTEGHVLASNEVNSWVL